MATQITPTPSTGTWLEVAPWEPGPADQILPTPTTGTWLEVGEPPTVPSGWSIGTLRFGGGAGWR